MRPILDLPRLFTIFGIVLLTMAEGSAIKLCSGTIAAWNQYAHLTEQRINWELHTRYGSSPLASTDNWKEIAVAEMTTLDERGKKIPVPDGLIHHWRGSILIPGVSLDQFVHVITNQRAKAEYYDEVLESRVIKKLEDGEIVYLKLKRSMALVDVAYNTEYKVQLKRRHSKLVSSRSVSTKIAEIIDLGEEDEREKPQGDDRGFLWRLNAYWHYQQVERGVMVHCETLTLSRGIPFRLDLVLRPIVKRIARNSMKRTLESLRDQVLKAVSIE